MSLLRGMGWDRAWIMTEQFAGEGKPLSMQGHTHRKVSEKEELPLLLNTFFKIYLWTDK